MSDTTLLFWGFLVFSIALVGFLSELPARPDSEGRERSGSIFRQLGARRLVSLAAGISLLLSVSLFFLVSREQGIFVGLWVPSLLSAGNLLLAKPR